MHRKARMFAANPLQPSDAAPASEMPLQRAVGRLDLSFICVGERTALKRLHQEGSLKARLPTSYGGCEAIVINTAGGVTGGDQFEVGVALETRAEVTLSAQACEKFYRSTGAEATLRTALHVAPGAKLHWLMQPAIAFDRARVRRTCTADVARGGELLAVEALVFGRTAMNETVTTGAFTDRWSIRRSGALVYSDAFRVSGAIQATLDRASALAGGRAVASVIYVADDAEARRDEMRSILGGLACVGGASAWNGVLAIRLVATDGFMLTRDLIHLLTAFRGAPPPRVWTI